MSRRCSTASIGNWRARSSTVHQPAQPSIPLQLTQALLDRVLQAYANNIDRTRLYVTGLSNGGYGTWGAIERWPDLFSAAAPIAGAGHGAWGYVYSLENSPLRVSGFFPWLFSQHR